MEKKLNIVIADDTTELGQNCAKAFKAYGMNVSLCEKDGRSILSKTKKEHPDIILADVFMPKCRNSCRNQSSIVSHQIIAD